MSTHASAVMPDRAARDAGVLVRVGVLAAFVVLYVASAKWGLDVSNDVGISAWYPPVALGLGLVILFGARWAPAIFVADLAQWALIGEQATPGAELAYAAILAVVLGGAGELIRRRLVADPPLSRLADLLVFIVVGAVIAPLLAAICITAIYIPVRGLPWSDFVDQARTLFVGDAIAITSLTPALLTLGAAVRGVPLAPASPHRNGVHEDVVAGIALVAIPVAAILSFNTELLYVGLLPLVWVALRRGIPGATLATAAWMCASVAALVSVDLEVELVDAQTFGLAASTLALICGTVVSERERGRSRLAHLALHDDVTGLPNQHRLMASLTDALSRERDRHVAILAVQLRGLRGVLTAIGRPGLDAMLASMAEQLRTATGPDATLARLSPSRFVVLLDGPAAGDAAALAERIAERLSTPQRVGHRELTIEVSVGVAIGSPDGDPDSLLARADAATERATRLGGSHSVVFDAALAAEVQRRRRVERALADAIDAGGLALAFQPIVGIDDAGPVDAEALLRWTTPDGVAMLPDEFIPVAEHTGLILRLGRWVLHEACRQAAGWPAVGGREVSVAVNVSPLQLQDVGFVDDVRDALRAAQLPAARLRLEVTESVLVEDLETAISRLDELQALGVEAMLDDFGTGYSSLSWIQRLPVTHLKVDRSFVAGLCEREVDRAIVRATIGLARAIGIGIVAEGVETEEQRTMLRELGCPRVQGFLICRPVPGDAFVAWLREAEGLRPTG